jgi:pyruvate dehydrogenase E2 component (dihydrolipoamide acetyltransferase)
MRVDVVMPQMGESIAEGPITRWMKQLGDAVARDEPLFEISTDKVDAEIPSPAAGKLIEIKNAAGETVPVNQVVAVLETDATAAATAGSTAAAPAPVAPPVAPTAAAPATPPTPAPALAAAQPKEDVPAPGAQPEAPRGDAAFVSPVVRKIAAEHGIDPERVPGTGAGGRVTKKDILDFVAKGPATAESAAPAASPAAPAATGAAAAPAVTFAAGARVSRQPMSAMRKKIAEHMVESRRTSAHVHSVFEVDMTRIVRMRETYKPIYAERHGTKLTMTPFFVKAACDALRSWPVVNSSVDGNDIVYKKDLNIGVAVALDWGLIVPVVKNADELSIAGMTRKINDLAERARTKTNPGIFGGLYGLPIINQPQVAILGIGGIEKRPVVVDDAIAIRSMMYLSMSYDHRVVDGAVADQFLAMVKNGLQEFDESLL